MKKKTETVASDDMYTLRRVSQDIETAEDFVEAAAFTRPDMEREFADWAQLLQAELDDAGWPPLSPMVRVMPDGLWKAIDDETKERVASRNLPELKFELGSKYIEKRVKPLSNEYFIWRISDQIAKFLREKSVNIKIAHAFEIGRIFEIWRASGSFKPELEIRLNQKRAYAEGRGGKREQHRREQIQKASEWKAEAARIAAEKWQRLPELSAFAMAGHVRPALKKLKYDKSVSTIRRAIAKVKPKPE